MYYLVYVMINRINGKRYVGAHQTNDLNDGYFGSGLGLRRAIDKYGACNFVRYILKHCDNADDMYKTEQNIVNIDIVNNPNYYNMTLGGVGGFYHINSDNDRINCMKYPEVVEKVSRAIRAKHSTNPEYYKQISITNLEKASMANTGSKNSKETVQKRINSIKEYYKEHDHVLKGKPMKENHRKKIQESWDSHRREKQSKRMKKRINDGLDMGQWTRGKNHSPETKKKMSDAAKDRKPDRDVVCPHCDKQGKLRAMRRWHFDNCRLKSDDI